MAQSASLIVGIGASAGGLAAFKNFLAHTPADSGMAFVLIQHLDPRHERSDSSRELPVHAVTIQPDTLLSGIAGRDSLQVNSRHHQAVRRVAGNLRVSASDPEDRTIEALEHPGRRFVLAVQWHPEDQARVDSGQLKIFRSFGAAIG